MGLHDKEETPAEDDDLTNLTWLQDRNLLKSINDARVKKDYVFLNEEEDDEENVYPSDEGCDSADGTQEDLINSHHVPSISYNNSQAHSYAKPPYSFSSLIFMAIESSSNKALPVKDIYAWITDHFPYYQNSPSGWKNTVRHNLSLNKCFKKLDKAKNDYVPIVGKGSLWCIDPDLRPNLLQALRRTPPYVYPYMSKSGLITSDSSLSPTDNKTDESEKTMPQIITAQKIGNRLLIPVLDRESKEADAAQSMLTLTRYSTEDSNVIIIDEKSEISEKIDCSEGKMDNCSTPATVLNPTGDHNYFSRSHTDDESRQQNNSESCKDQVASSSKETNDMVQTITIVSGGRRTEGTVLIKRGVYEDDEEKGAEALLNLAARNRDSVTKSTGSSSKSEPSKRSRRT